MKSLLWIILYIIVGGVTFWLVDVSVHLARGDQFSGLDVQVLTLLLPLTTICFYTILYWFKGRQPDAPSIAIFMLVGLWLLGPTCLKLGRVFNAEWGWIATFTLNPMYTWIIATYSGSLFGLQIASILLLLMHFIFERHHWVIPLRIFRLRSRFQ